jgi:hypothetical protein
MGAADESPVLTALVLSAIIVLMEVTTPETPTADGP